MASVGSYLSDSVGFAISAAMVLAYLVFLRLKLRRNPLYTIHAINRKARAAWVAHVMQDDSRRLLAIQTLRNTTMAATFLASTAVLLMIGTLNLTGQGGALSSAWQALNLFGQDAPGLWTVKVLLLVSDFFVAFFSFAMAVRLYNHVGYQIALPPGTEALDLITVPKVTAMLIRAGIYYTFGMRAYYAAVPLVFWLFGPHFMLLGTIAIIIVLLYIDRVPRAAH